MNGGGGGGYVEDTFLLGVIDIIIGFKWCILEHFATQVWFSGHCCHCCTIMCNSI